MKVLSEHKLTQTWLHSVVEQSGMWDRWKDSGPLWLWLVVMSSPTKSRSMLKLGVFESWCLMLSGLSDLPGNHMIFECNGPLVWITPKSTGRLRVKVYIYIYMCVCVFVLIVFRVWPHNLQNPYLVVCWHQDVEINELLDIFRAAWDLSSPVEVLLVVFAHVCMVMLFLYHTLVAGLWCCTLWWKHNWFLGAYFPCHILMCLYIHIINYIYICSVAASVRQSWTHSWLLTAMME